MSHLTTFKNKSLVDTNREMLIASLKEIGITADFSKKTINSPYTRSWTEEEKTVDCILFKEGKELPIGLKFVANADGEEVVEVAGDFWGTGINNVELTNQIAQVYQKNDIIKKCISQRWYVTEDNVSINEEGEYVIQASRFA